MFQNNSVIGWDVGGAHLKAALLDAQGVARQVVQVPCPLWRGLAQLEQAVEAVLREIPLASNQHVITMTGELVDIFANRHEGVLSIAKVMCESIEGEVFFFAGQHDLVPPEQVAKHTDDVASANWLASATFVAQALPQALLIDIGSTTSDLVLLSDGKAHPLGLSDAERMRFDELVYTGVVRTPLMALCQKINFKGDMVNIAAEHFATTADVYRLTGELLPQYDMADTADGAGKSELESARRLARMIGHDVEYADMGTWKALAYEFRRVQIARLQEAVERAFLRNIISKDAPLVGAGAGRYLIAAMAKEMGRRFVKIEDLIQATSSQQKQLAGLCLPAYAVAKLAQISSC